MAAGENKTEKPTPRRLEKARKEGQVIQSPEMLSAATLVALVGSAALMGPWFVRFFRNQIQQALTCDVTAVSDSQVFIEYINQKIIDAMLVMAPFLLILMISFPV